MAADEDVIARALKDFSFANVRKFTLNLEQEVVKIYTCKQTDLLCANNYKVLINMIKMIDKCNIKIECSFKVKL